MYRRPVRASLQRLVNRLKRFFHRDLELPDDPYAMVGAPKKPRPPYSSAAAKAEFD